MAAPQPSIVFDFDGTLVDSARGILATVEQTLRIHAVVPRIALRRTIIGPPLMQTLQLVSGMTDPGMLSMLAADFKRQYDSDGFLDTDPFPGIEGALSTLKHAGISLHVATNKRGAPTRKVLEHLGWTAFFKSVYCLDECAGCPDKGAMLGLLLTEQGLPATRSLYIGDTQADAAAAATNFMPFLGVAWGYGNDWASGIQLCDAPGRLASAAINLLGLDAPCPAS